MCPHVCVCAHTCTHTHTHTHTGSTGFPIISGSLQTSWILPTVSEWEPQPLVTWEAFSSSAFARGKELFLFPCAWENYRSYLIIGESQPTKPHACCFRSWSFCSFQPKMALSFREKLVVAPVTKLLMQHFPKASNSSVDWFWIFTNSNSQIYHLVQGIG